MSDFNVPVVKVLKVEKHPDADTLDLVYVLGYTCISKRLEDGTSRYKEGDLCVYIPENSVLPDWLLRKMEFWDNNKNIGALSGSKGNRVKPKRLRGIYSEGILYRANFDDDSNEYDSDNPLGWYISRTVPNEDDESLTLYMDFMYVDEGENVAEFLGITKYEPQVPSSMAGQVSGEYIDYTMKYDFDALEDHPRLFSIGEEVVVTEKIHGTLMQIGFIPELNDPNLFMDNILVTSKGMGAKGYVLKLLPENANNLYVKMLMKFLDDGLYGQLNNLVGRLNIKYNPEKVNTIHLFGEIFGKGIQDLTYGMEKPTFRLFDIAVNKRFLNYSDFLGCAYYLSLPVVPELYNGPFTNTEMFRLRDGKDTMSNSHVREGIVIRSKEEQYHTRYGRKIAKLVSPDYKLRKGGTEYN